MQCIFIQQHLYIFMLSLNWFPFLVSSCSHCYFISCTGGRCMSEILGGSGLWGWSQTDLHSSACQGLAINQTFLYGFSLNDLRVSKGSSSSRISSLSLLLGLQEISLATASLLSLVTPKQHFSSHRWFQKPFWRRSSRYIINNEQCTQLPCYTMLIQEKEWFKPNFPITEMRKTFFVLSWRLWFWVNYPVSLNKIVDLLTELTNLNVHCCHSR